MHDALLTPEVWRLLCHSISRVNNSILLLQTGSAEHTSQATPAAFPLNLEAMRKSFESHGIHRSRLIFAHRGSQLGHEGLMTAAAAAAAAADVVVDFSASSVYALAAAAPVSCSAACAVFFFIFCGRYLHLLLVKCREVISFAQVLTAPLHLPSHRVAGADWTPVCLLLRACMHQFCPSNCADAECAPLTTQHSFAFRPPASLCAWPAPKTHTLFQFEFNGTIRCSSAAPLATLKTRSSPF
jgi:hypothetical protein